MTSDQQTVTVALAEACEAIAHLLEWWPVESDPGPGIRADLERWRRLLNEHGYLPPAGETRGDEG